MPSQPPRPSAGPAASITSATCAVIGDWHLAFITAAGLAELGHSTLLVNPLGAGKTPWPDFPELALNEPGLPETIAEARGRGKLAHVNGVDAGWAADFVWLAIDTPVDERDEPDTSTLLRAAQDVAASGCCKGVFVVTSQVPLGFCAQLEETLGLTVACVPENLRLGKGIETFLRADRLVIGASASETRAGVRALLAGIDAQCATCDLPTAEMIKHATNAFLATSISFANELARVGERNGVDSQLVAAALKMDRRIGPLAYVAPGLGFAGGTLPRDLRVLARVGRAHGVATPLVDAVLDVNESTITALVDSVASFLGRLDGREVLVLGYSYKADTDTLRRSPSLELAARLRAQGAVVLGYDPFMNERDLSPLEGVIEHRAHWSEFHTPPDATIVMTPRKEFASIAWDALEVRRSRVPPPLVLDARGIVSSRAVLRAGFAYKALWQPVQLP
ncbi:MAG TPA: nucleotide sugar dehydrogenase [Polyangiaceae bacterium]|jgi:UDPglucose 6-dehydrogenase|nr:nucleotide sugar dehydrogenase [Polyangiaceae bacterium]